MRARWRGVRVIGAAAVVLAAGMAGYGVHRHLAKGAASEAEQNRLVAELERSERAAEHQAFTSSLASQRSSAITLARGETLALAVNRAGARWNDVDRAMAAVSAITNPRRLRPGQEVIVYLETGAEPAVLTGLALQENPGETITVSRTSDGGFAARRILMPLNYEVAHVRGAVNGSLYQAAIEGGATEREVAAMADVFAYDVDFQRDVFPGDEFEFLFEKYTDEEGRTVRTGDLLFVSLEARRGLKSFYRFTPEGAPESEWFDSEGKTARKFLMKTPINGARLSSAFGMRRHPILGYSKMHRGADFAAPTGTPIMAAGDGVIERAGWFGSYGKYIKIKHSGEYQTAYGHMSALAKGVRPGMRVRQGQVIGYVGSTGRSTGPHLHYEVFAKGANINPMSMRVPTGRVLTGAQLKAFEAERARIDALRARDEAAQVLTVAFKPETGKSQTTGQAGEAGGAD